MRAMINLQGVYAVYYILSSSTVGFVGFYHCFVQNKKNEFLKEIMYNRSAYINPTRKNIIERECFIKSLPVFFFGMLIGPTAPIFYLVGMKGFDWKRCPKLK